MHLYVQHYEFEDYNETGFALTLTTTTTELSMKMRDGEPEDNTLERNFSDITSIPAFLREAYEAGLRGEEFTMDQVLNQTGEFE